MLKNYIKIAWRSLLRNRTFTLINVSGLALGIAVFLFITQYVAFECGANRFHKNYDRLYRIDLAHPQGSSDYYIPPGFAPLLKNSLPGIKHAVRIADGSGNGLVSIDKGNNREQYRNDKISYVDADFFRVFSFNVLKGNIELSEPRSASISVSTARKYFGTENAVGKTMAVDNQFGHTLYTVTSVYEDLPAQSDITADVVLSLKTLDDAASRNDNDWADPKGLQSGYTNIYLLLNPTASAQQITDQANRLKNNVQPENKADRFVLQPLNELHLAPSLNYPLQTYGNTVLVLAFAAVALLILAIAWVNYINLSVAQSLNRSREIGVRKVLGAERKQIVFQFLTETATITFFSLLISFLLVYLFQPLYNNLVGRQLSLSVINQGLFWPMVILLTLLGALASGFYVAFLLSSADPLKTISGKATINIGGVSFRKGLIVFQFAISVVFIISTLVLYKQLDFMKTQDLGMKVDQRLVIVGPSVNGGKAASQSFKDQLATLPFVEKFAASNDIPGKGYNFNASGITRLNPNPGDEKKDFSMLQIDDNYLATYDIKLLQGRNFSQQGVSLGYTKSPELIINEKAAEQFGFAKGQNIIGQKINWGKTYEIVGVVKNYHHLSLHEQIMPMIFIPAVSSGFYTIKINTKDIQNKINKIKSLYQANFPGNPFDYFFLDENYDKQYQSEQKLGSIFIISALIAVLIACMGLFGMASFAAQQRVKEIGIRKVLGASVTSIVKLISGDFLKLVFISVVFAVPVAAYLMNAWLKDFAYRIDLAWWLFALAGLIAVVIALITVSTQAIKAAVVNPVKSLRSE